MVLMCTADQYNTYQIKITIKKHIEETTPKDSCRLLIKLLI